MCPEFSSKVILGSQLYGVFGRQSRGLGISGLSCGGQYQGNIRFSPLNK